MTDKGAGDVAVELREVTRSYGHGLSTRQVLGPVSLRVPTGAFVALRGPSGSGKSTLLHLVAGLSRPTSGTVLVGGRDLGRLSEAEAAEVRRRTVGMVFQAYNLVPVLSVEENVALPGVISGLEERENRRRARELLEAVGLEAQARELPLILSGGEQQRAALARALLMRPSVLVADEPTGSLDSVTGSEVMGLLERLRAEFGLTILLATHDEVVSRAADEVVFLRDGLLAPAPVSRPARRVKAAVR